jgi:hypothetical protein
LLSAIVRQSFSDAYSAIAQIVGEEKARSMSNEQIGLLVANIQEDGQVYPDGIEDETGNYDPSEAETLGQLVELGALVETRRGWAVPCIVSEKHAEYYKNRQPVYID